MNPDLDPCPPISLNPDPDLMNMDPNDGKKNDPTPKYSRVAGAKLSGTGFCKPFTSVVLIQKVWTGWFKPFSVIVLPHKSKSKSRTGLVAQSVM